jgi:hypothetical protein
MNLPAKLSILALAFVAYPAFAQTNEAQPAWEVSVGGGLAAIEQQTDQPFASLTLRRNLGGGYLDTGLSYIDSGTLVPLATGGLTVPASTFIASLGAGFTVGRWTVEGYAAHGWRRFQDAQVRGQSGRIINVDRSGTLITLSGSVSHEFTLGERTGLAPFAGVDYTKLDFAFALVPAGGQAVSSQRQSSDGVTGRAGLLLVTLVGDDGSSIGVSAAGNTASNIAAVTSIGGGGTLVPRLVQSRDIKDSWADIGANASLSLGHRLWLDLSVVQTLGFDFGEVTAGTASLRIGF